MRLRVLIISLLIIAFASAAVCQDDDDILLLKKKWKGGGSAIAAIVLDATCTGTQGAGGIDWQSAPCSAPMTVTAGDTITCEGFVQGSNTFDVWFNDPTNGTYNAINSGINGTNTTNWTQTAVFANSAGGSITPQMNIQAPGNVGFACQAWKNTLASNVVDGGTVNQFQAANASNPTSSGSTAAPTNNNEVIVCALDRASAATTSAGTGFSPAGTLTGVTNTWAHYFEYMIQTTATAENCPYTSASAQYTDNQFALLNSTNPAGYNAAYGMYGFPASAQTNGATATLAILNTQNSGTAWTTHGSPTTSPWSQGSGSAVTFDTSINPTGTKKIILNGAAHTFGDAGGSILFPAANTTTSYLWTDNSDNLGQPMWLSYFTRFASSGIANGQVCDTVQASTAQTGVNELVQMSFATGTNVGFKLESDAGTGSSVINTGLSTDTDYFFQIHIAGVNERNHQVLVYSKSTTWSLVSTLNYDVLCGTLAQNNCSTPTASGSGTGSASSGTTSLAITSGTGSITAGQVVFPTTGIPYLTVVEVVSGTCSSSCTVTLSNNTTATVSGTVNFVTAPAKLSVVTTCTGSSGSTSLSCTAPTVGTIANNQLVGSNDGNVIQGSFVKAVSGVGPITVTLNQPLIGAESAGVTFWSANTNTNKAQIGKWSSCSFADNVWYSGVFFDPLGAWGAFAPN